jgi:hypothetical protein
MLPDGRCHVDKLGITVAPKEVGGYDEPAIGLWATAVVNGCALPEILDVDTFFQALTASGLLPLFTCDCGVFGCGGYYVGVTSTEVSWTWRARYAPEDAPNPEHLVDEGEYCFAWAEVRAAAMGLLATLHELKRDKPGVRLMVAETGINLASRLEAYATQVRDIPED